jgi:protein-disulfide isomerase
VNDTQPPAASDCDQQGLSVVKELGDRLRINATPTLYFADGHRASGAIANEKLELEFAASETHIAANRKQQK